MRVHLDIDAQSDMTWVVVNDPIPAGATILGSGLGRDSSATTEGEQQTGSGPAFVERGFDGYLPKGKLQVEYTMRGTIPAPSACRRRASKRSMLHRHSARCQMRR